ncbi:GNAT family N-acetyltransferase [Actinoallomurus soli]|uniref:GNAT family N-acetyltransferase n=1 Tax=Actinoallomurus soli TaxID=2952535 RepID=UPI002092A2CE|nr:GNAT family N-acetyltransferase [Actinoallomurus soli]MCO5966793.1 GNAT family N-acetyltransferase [Actinoallomurus soli]
MGVVGVRAAYPGDVAAVAEIQVRAWREGYRSVIPEAALAEMTGPEAVALWRERWADAVAAPPSPRHRLLVAVDEGVITGFAAHAPAGDPDQDPQTTGELLTLLVDPARGRAGHGSRLLAATVDHLREDGCTTAIAWVFAADDALRGFLASAGWAPDGAHSKVDMGEPVAMVRLHTAIA